jgi:hypothetical protein
MKNIVITIVMGVFLVGLMSCERDRDEPKLSEPTAHIHTPMDGGTYQAGDTIPIQIHFEDADELHEFSVKVRNQTTNIEEFSRDGHSHNNFYEANTFVILSPTTTTNFELEAMVSNHNGLMTTETISFAVVP